MTAEHVRFTHNLSVVDLADFSEDDTSEDGGFCHPEEIAYLLMHEALLTKSPLGFAVQCAGAGVALLQFSISKLVVLIRTHKTGSLLPTPVRELLSERSVTKGCLCDAAALEQVMLTSFGVELAGVMDVREFSREEAKTQGAEARPVVASSPNQLSLLEGNWAAEELSPMQKQAAADQVHAAWQVIHRQSVADRIGRLQPGWHEQGIRKERDGLHCFICGAGPIPSQMVMQAHIDSKPHRRRLREFAFGIDLLEVPEPLKERGIYLKTITEHGVPQYCCSKCNAGPFGTLESVQSHLQGEKHLRKEGRTCVPILTAALQQEGFYIVEGALICGICRAGPFSDQGSLRQHRRSVEHRSKLFVREERRQELEREVLQLPGYVNVLHGEFCCFLCNSRAANLPMMLRHLVSKKHRKTCCLIQEPQPMVLNAGLVPDDIALVYPLQGVFGTNLARGARSKCLANIGSVRAASEGRGIS
eukprot:TRINITY_DN30214_c0_g1_i1.p1 TRINITY_DN30214_c0_g1~~TRINITY_DN30214_c0_g1_i1.p1  ORF type:complete len:474 (-),score=93.24 TRINITY_DN30214_c0_g1_i1:200-1621(-)